MRKLFALFLVLALALSASTALANAFDMNAFNGNDIFTVSFNDDHTSCFIDTSEGLKVPQKAFEHKYEHPTKYSYIYTDIVVVDYYGTNPYPVIRTWIEYAGTKNINATSVTFSLPSGDYTFSGIGKPDRISQDDDGVYETLLIKFGPDNTTFLNELSDICLAASAEGGIGLGNIPAIPFVIHGTEDLEGMMSTGSIIDAGTMNIGFVTSGGLNFLDLSIEPTPMTVTAH